MNNHVTELKTIDPLTKQGEKDPGMGELSPMDPPDAYSPPGVEEVPYDEMHAFLQGLMDDHKAVHAALDDFERAIIAIPEHGITRETDEAIRNFFAAFDETFIPHDRREEKRLFPLLEERLIENGEFGNGETKITAVDMMEADHLKAIQLAGVVFNFFGLALRLPDQQSQILVLDSAIEQGKVLVELLKLHIFREDNIVFPLAHKYIRADEFDEMCN